MNIYEEIVKLQREGRSGAVATIVNSRGSIPSFQSAKMLIRDDGSIAGTIGGGCVEGEVWLKSDLDTATYRYIGAEARAREGGWESLGDLGWVDSEGFVYIADLAATIENRRLASIMAASPTG